MLFSIAEVAKWITPIFPFLPFVNWFPHIPFSSQSFVIFAIFCLSFGLFQAVLFFFQFIYVFLFEKWYFFPDHVETGAFSTHPDN